MKIEKIKLSHHFHPITPSSWLGVEVSVDDSEDPVRAFQLAKEIIEVSYKAINPNMPLPIISVSKESSDIMDAQFSEAKAAIESAPFFEDAEYLLNEYNFKYNIELKNIVNSKPKRSTDGTN